MKKRKSTNNHLSNMAIQSNTGITVDRYLAPEFDYTEQEHLYFKGMTGNKIRKQIVKRTFGINNRGGIVSQALREMGRQRNLALIANNRGNMTGLFSTRHA